MTTIFNKAFYILNFLIVATIQIKPNLKKKKNYDFVAIS